MVLFCPLWVPVGLEWQVKQRGQECVCVRCVCVRACVCVCVRTLPLFQTSCTSLWPREPSMWCLAPPPRVLSPPSILIGCQRGTAGQSQPLCVLVCYDDDDEDEDDDDFVFQLDFALRCHVQKKLFLLRSPVGKCTRNCYFFYFFLWLIVTHSIFFVKLYIHMHIHIYVSIYIDIYIYICRYRYTYFSIRTWTNHDILFWQGLCQSPFMTFILKVILVLRHPAGILPMPTSRVRLLPTDRLTSGKTPEQAAITHPHVQPDASQNIEAFQSKSAVYVLKDRK